MDTVEAQPQRKEDALSAALVKRGAVIIDLSIVVEYQCRIVRAPQSARDTP